MTKSRLSSKLIIAIPIIVAVVILCVLLFMGLKKYEGFNTNLNQIDNVIATSFTSKDIIPTDVNTNLQQVGFDNKESNKESSTESPTTPFTPTYKSKVVLKDTYVIKQIHITNITGNFRIGVKNSSRNKISYVSSLELNKNAISEVFANNSPKYVMMTMFNSTGEFKDLNPVDIYGNELVGDEIIFYTDNNNDSNSDSKIYIMGHLENEHFHDKHDTQKLERGNTGNVGYDIIQSDKTVLEKPSLDTETPFGITKMVISVEKNTNIKVLFQNNYSNNSFTFEGPLPNREFIVTPEYNTIFFHHTLLANKIVVINTNTTDDTKFNTNDIEVYGYTPSIDDVNRFKLEYNLTDVRGSINPDDVCPSLDQYMNDQLSSEIVIDAMEYQDKINMEKMKLSNNKASMLTLLEQEEEIKKLERMINKIDNLHEQRKHTTNALNALHLRRQMDEVLKLRDVLDSRIAIQEKNTINIPVDINRVQVIDDTEEKSDDNLDVFADIPISKEEDMKLK